MMNSRHSGRVSVIALSAGLGVLLTATGEAAAQTLPTGGTVAAGAATIGPQTAGALTINQTSNKAVINWTGFSIGRTNGVTFVQPNAGSAVLNRVTGNTTSTIAGTLTANGRVYLVNPNGIQITSTGVVRSSGFTASTLDIGDKDFLDGKSTFSGGGNSAAVGNAGSITIDNGGDAALIGGRVSNSGTIAARNGRIGLGAGERVSVDVEGDGFLTVSVPTSDSDRARALVENTGRLRAAGGRVALRAATSADVARSAINLGGSVEATTVRRGKGGSVAFGNVVVDGGAGGAVTVKGRIAANGVKGGSIKVLGRTIALAGATLDASGRTGGGSIRIGGDFHGAGTLPTATTTTVDAASTLKADATAKGNGGTVVAWANDTTSFGGHISARGGAEGGNGGDAEVSGKAHLALTADYDSVALADLRAAKGEAGTLLLDPGTVTIVHSASAAPAGPDTFTDTFIAQQLASGNLGISTDNATNGGTPDIRIGSGVSVNWATATTLTLAAANDIYFDPSATMLASGGGALVLRADSDASGVGSADVDIVNQLSFGGGLVQFFRGTDAYTLITTQAQLQAIGGGLSGNYALATNIALAGSFNSIGTAANAFVGKLDGLGNTLTGLSVDTPAQDNVGLFAAIGNSGAVGNLTLANASVRGATGVGALAGLNQGSIYDVSVSGAVTGQSNVGGLVGVNEGTIVRSSSAGSVVASGDGAGGLVGANGSGGGKGQILQSFSTANVSGGSGVGGLVGFNYLQSTIADAYAWGSATGTKKGVGGLAGFNLGAIDRAYAIGAVTTGPAGTLFPGGPLATGGLVGQQLPSSTGSGNYWDPTTTGQSIATSVTNTGTLTATAVASSSPAAAFSAFDPTIWRLVDAERPIFAHSLAPAVIPPVVTPPVVVPPVTTGIDSTITQFFRTPTQLNAIRLSGPQVSGSGLGGIFAPGVANIVTASTGGGGTSENQPGIANIVTSSIGDGAGADGAAQCFVRLDAENGGTLSCPVEGQ